MVLQWKFEEEEEEEKSNVVSGLKSDCVSLRGQTRSVYY